MKDKEIDQINAEIQRLEAKGFRLIKQGDMINVELNKVHEQLNNAQVYKQNLIVERNTPQPEPEAVGAPKIKEEKLTQS